MNQSEQPITFIPEEVLVQHDTSRKLLIYFALLQTKGREVNLVSRETIDSDLPVLAAESLLPFGILGPGEYSRYLDIGSGGGFPSIPVVLTQTVRRAWLVDRDFKKAVALEHMLKELPIAAGQVTVLNQNFGEIPLDGGFDLVTLRLVKLTPKLLKQILPVMAPHGLLIYYATPEMDLGKFPVSCKIHYYLRPGSSSRKSFSIIKKN